MLRALRGYPSWPGTGKLPVPVGLRWECRLSPGEAVLKGLEQHEHPHDLTPGLCSQLARASVGVFPVGSRGWVAGWAWRVHSPGGSTERCWRSAAGRGPARHPLTLSLSLSFLSVPLCRSACYIPPFLHIFLLGFRVHSLEIRFTVK